ncbi:hypothetical protein [Streptomyces sp. Da 82-17]|uniref:hypothetical protein n=1 Tax=Streptomyces sp. Da 82-17 TaxID=3377116 RepID=UPI0038D4BFB2
MRKAVLTAVALLGAGAAVAATTSATAARTEDAPAPAAGRWQQIGHDMRSGISGLAVTSRSGGTYRALIARDNKRPGENRVARLTYHPGEPARTPAAQPLEWRGSAEPNDLEALEAVPGAPGEYLAVASRGLVYRLQVTADGDAVEVRDLSPLPAIGQGDNFESFTLASRHGRLAAAWADRGEGADRPATLYTAPLSFNKYGETVFGAVTKATTYRAPYPTGDVRHVADLTVTDSGRLLVASASDAGDDGPFDSAVTDAGTLSLDATGEVRLSLAETPEVVRKFQGRKIEAVECVPGSDTALLGTDDENTGGAVTTARICD